MADTDVQVEPTLRRQKKITDIPAAITSRNMIDRYRSGVESAEIRRTSLVLQKPRKPGEWDPWRRRSTSYAATQPAVTKAQRKANGAGPKRSPDKSSPATSSSSSSNHRSVKDCKSSSSDSSQNMVSHSKHSNGGYFDSYFKHLQTSCSSIQLGKSIIFPSYGTLAQMDLSYLEPFENRGLFSASGVTGRKARMSSADSLHRYGSVQDLSGFKDSTLSFSGFKLRRSSSLVDFKKLAFNKSVLQNVKQPPMAQCGHNARTATSKTSVKSGMQKNKKEKKPITSRTKTVDRANVNSRSIQRQTVSRYGNKSVSTKPQNTNDTEENEKDVRSGNVENEPQRRVVKTQTTEDHEGEFEVVGYL